MNNVSANFIASGSVGSEMRDIVCLSHLRWDFVFQRPQHLLSRAARDGRRVFFVEEPILGHEQPHLDVSTRRNDATGEASVILVQPHLPHGLSFQETEAEQRRLLDELIEKERIADFVLWHYTPMARGFASHLRPHATVYDCMDELSMFKDAPPELREREAELLASADLIFTGGQSIYEAKAEQLADATRLHCFPSSIDFAHFAQARTIGDEPADQIGIAHPRLGFFGVVDERFDIELLREMAEARPEWQFVIIGPIVKIDPAILPRNRNIHYPGGKSYAELPAYLAGWDVALLLFARNDATRFISPTKTPEYLAAAKPVVSTSIRDVVRPYGEQGFVRIADSAAEMIAAAEDLMSDDFDRTEWINRVDAFLANTSWDETWRQMRALVGAVGAQQNDVRQEASVKSTASDRGKQHA
jgi:UDP-galactopyranose mutase